MERTRSARQKYARLVTGTAALLVDSPGVTTPRGCTVTEGLPRVTPGGYYTNGATVCTAHGIPHLFHGVDRSAFEWDPAGQNVSLADFQAMAGWHANVVRIPMNQDFWLTGAWLHNHLPTGAFWSLQEAQSYPSTIAQAVQWAEAAGLDVILDLHFSDQGNLGVTEVDGSSSQDSPGNSAQQQMADVNSVTFWKEVATMFKGDGRVLFELYNEPNGIGWSTWLNGGTEPGFPAVGMQQLYDTVRGTGADNVVIAGGLNWAFDLSGVSASPIRGYNVMYATHTYWMNDTPAEWPTSFGYLAVGDIAPVIVTEFADGVAMCTGAWDTSLIQFADMNKISWTAWAWYPGGCVSFPSLISDWSYTPTVEGVVVKAALLGYPWPPPASADAAADGGPLDATLDGTLGDAISDRSSTEAFVEDGPADTLSQADAAGDASEGGAVHDSQ
jgi:hypothetical protein